MDYDVVSASFNVIIIFRIFGQYRAIRKPDSGGIKTYVCKTDIFVNGNFFSYKNWKQNQKISNTALTLSLWIKVL